MPLSRGQSWVMAFVASRSRITAGTVPHRGGITDAAMLHDIEMLARCCFVNVDRQAGVPVRVTMTPRGWGYLRSRAAAIDAIDAR